MKHRISGKKLNRPTSHRQSLLANLAASLIEHEQIVTTLPKAKTIRPFVEKLVTLAKRGDLHARRQARSIVRNDEAVSKLFSVLGERYKSRPGGYLRIIKYGIRYGDAAPRAVIEFVDRDEEAKGQRDRARLAAQQVEAVEVGQAG